MAKVLVVDDSLSVRKVVERALEARSIHVVSAASGGEALARIEGDQPDLVICDVLMPDKDGYEICEYIKRHPALGRTPVLLISGIVNSAVLARAAEVQSDSVMRKPFAADELMRRVDSLLTSGPNGASDRARVGAAPRQEPLARPDSAPGALIGRPAGPPTPSPAAPAADLAGALAPFAGTPGVALAALVDREGFLVEAAGEPGPEGELPWALCGWLSGTAEELGRTLGQGVLQTALLEYDGGTVLVTAIGARTLLVLLLRDPTILGKVRYSVKRALPELLRLL